MIEKITEGDLFGKGVIGLDDAPGLSKDEMQKRFEQTAREVIIPRLNALIGEFIELVRNVEGLALESGNVTQSQIDEWNAKSDFSGSFNDLTDVPPLVSETAGTFDDSAQLAIPEGNSEYQATVPVSSLTVTYPVNDFETWISFTTADSGDIVITLPAATKCIGEAPSFGNGEAWELSIKNGVLIAGKVNKEE